MDISKRNAVRIVSFTVAVGGCACGEKYTTYEQ